MQVFAWYRAAGSGRCMTLADYITTGHAAVSLTPPTPEIVRAEITSWRTNLAEISGPVKDSTRSSISALSRAWVPDLLM